ncbi:hypothetical protein BV96_02924 [Sphingomonas paucimobilis]|nr:hypothetical protein BV96_02924 [Sphingomonas paucimobilis]
MTEVTLYAAPRACSLVTLIALEAAGIAYRAIWLNLVAREQREPGYLAVNPRGKVPVLVTPQGTITENAAILAWIAGRAPKKRLLPDLGTAEGVPVLSDLAWFSSGIHPLLTRMLVPQRITDDAECQRLVAEYAAKLLPDEFALIEERLSRGGWWLDQWSLLDGYLFWIWNRAMAGPLDLSPYRAFADHARRMLQEPPVARAVEAERRGAN